MNWGELSFAAGLFVATSIASPLAWHAWRRREVAGATSLALMAAGITIWTTAAAVYCFLTSPTAQSYCVAVQFAGVALLPPAWLAFALRFSGRRSEFSKAPLLMAGFIGAAMVTLVATNGGHELVWHHVVRNGRSVSERWVAYWIFFGYVYIVSVAGAAILVKTAVELPQNYRKQGWAMVGAGLVSLATSVLGQLGVFRDIVSDPTPFGFVLSVLLIWWGLFRFGILDLIPVARGILLDNMVDGMLLIDARERVLDLNRAAVTMLEGLSERSVGRPAAQEIRAWPQLRQTWKSEGTVRPELKLTREGAPLFLELRTTPLTGPKGQPTGYLILLRDVTERHDAEVLRESLIAGLRAALAEVKTLSGLLPICCHCKKIRDQQDQWHQLEAYLTQYTEVMLTHGLCPDCFKRLYPEL